MREAEAAWVQRFGLARTAGSRAEGGECIGTRVFTFCLEKRGKEAGRGPGFAARLVEGWKLLTSPIFGYQQ